MQFSTQSVSVVFQPETGSIFVKDYTQPETSDVGKLRFGEKQGKGKDMWILWVILGSVIVGFIL